MKALPSLFLALLMCVLSALAQSVPADAGSGKKAASTTSVFDLPMRVAVVRNNSPGCEPLCPQWISAEGQITAATPALFRKALAKVKDQRLPVIIISTGGDVYAALAIGEMIRARHLDVALGLTYFAGCAPDRKDCKLPRQQGGIYRGTAASAQAFCVSACVLVLAAGEKRFRDQDTFIGVHQVSWAFKQEIERYRIVNGKKKILSRKIVNRKPKSSVSTKLRKTLEKKLLAYVARMGVDKKLLALFERAPSSGMYMMAGDEVRATKLITDVRPTAELTAGNLCGGPAPAANCIPLASPVKP